MILDTYMGPYFEFPAAWITIGVVVLPLACLALLALYGRRTRLCSPWIVFSVGVLVGAAFLYLGTVMQVGNMPGARYPYIALLVTMSAIFMTGMMTWRAAIASILITLGYGVSQSILVYSGLSHTDYGLFFLAATIVIGTAGSWRLEHTDRQQFLLSRILAEMAEHDSLTGLLNHGAFIAHCERAWRQAARESKPVGLMIADIDHFKEYNDHYGHPAGDECLVRIGELLAHSGKRGLDAAGRLGGEEFAVFWYGISGSDLERLVERVRKRVSDLAIPHMHSPVTPHVTVSIGALGLTPRSDQPFEIALQTTDKALYAAKAAGRNRVVVLTSTGEPAANEEVGNG